MKLEKYSMGIGDRFAQQGKAQLSALLKAVKSGVTIVPVWNKSHREHTIIHTLPVSARVEADSAVKDLNWKESYYVDADHIGFENVDLFMDSSDFFTLDVADFTGKKCKEDEINKFVERYSRYLGELRIPGIEKPLLITKDVITAAADKFLLAVKEAGKIYQRIVSGKGENKFITEVSMDETDNPQTPVELLFILAAIAEEKIPAQTIAPKFTGRFNKGVDYIGNLDRFETEFNEDLAVIKWCIKEFNLPENLKLSIHSGSDKFSIYPIINKAIHKFDAGLHLKTAGTTWLEELIGLAEAGGEGLTTAKEIYSSALGRYDELCGPYTAVIDINQSELPSVETVNNWSGKEFASALRHDQSCASYNLNFRQLLHVGYKIAAEMGERYKLMLKKYESVIAENVSENIFDRHIKRIFI